MTLDQMSASALDDTFLLDNTNIIGTYMMLDSQKISCRNQRISFSHNQSVSHYSVQIYGIGAVFGILTATVLGQLYGRRGMLTTKSFKVLTFKNVVSRKNFPMLAS